MERIAVISYYQPCRASWVDHLYWQIEKQTRQPELTISVARETGLDKDLTLRVREGLEKAKECGVDIVYFFEVDDYYDEKYLEQMDIGTKDFIGLQKTYYYNLKQRRYQLYTHTKRSSLFCTGLRISAMDKFNWPNDSEAFLDLDIWKYAGQRGNFKLLYKDLAIGLKDGQGHGVGHRVLLRNPDNDMEWLKSRVDCKSFEKYVDSFI